MNRLFLLALAVGTVVTLSTAADPARTFPHAQGGGTAYRIKLVNQQGKISLPDEPGKKTYFINLAAVDQPPHGKFGGPNGGRFIAWLFEKKAAPNPRTGGESDVSTLFCVEVANNRHFSLTMGKEFNLAELAPGKK